MKLAFQEYEEMYQRSISQPDDFWGSLSRNLISWSHDFHTVSSGSLMDGDVSWFLGGELNAAYNCVDRHAMKNPDRVAIIFESDSDSGNRTITYKTLLQRVSQLSFALKNMGVRKGDIVAIYLPMVPEAVIALLACARIGAVHSVIFAGFSSDSLRDRITDAKCRILLTADEGQRGGKKIGIKKIVDEALLHCPEVRNVLVLKHTGGDVAFVPGRDRWWHEEVEKWPKYMNPEPLSAEHPLFLLYTSGSTGKPKGIMHSTGGYLVGAAATAKYVFNLHQGDRYFCAGDIGWITGHTYVVYAPLLLGLTTVVFEGTPTFPDYSRYWKIVEQHQITHFYVAPTALRLLKRAGNEPIDKHKTESLRVLGSVGEPIAPEIWNWYHDVVGKGRCHVVDTYWQTETGSHTISPLAGITPTKPGSASLPFFGIDPVLIDSTSGKEIHGNAVEGDLAFKQPWPSMARTIWGAHKRYIETYLRIYQGYYFTGDGAYRDNDGYYWISGRVDDVINVSGHRLSTAEVEAALLMHQSVAEAAVVGASDDLTGQSVNAFVSIKRGDKGSEHLVPEMIAHIRKVIGPFATPKRLFIVPDLPKTRSGKIMRRIVRKILSGEEEDLGDITTLSDPSVVSEIIDININIGHFDMCHDRTNISRNITFLPPLILQTHSSSVL
ncbi:acetyl-coenzyme A synthetase-like protein [Paramyrothecium foliicola]|nr:acetyl-coenzyme A synthetase-like protein [Paramyrothecium foliicola]